MIDPTATLSAESAIAAGYRLLGPSSSGGSSQVHKARALATGHTVALKLLRAGHDQERLRREARLLQALEHPHVVRFVERIRIDERDCLVTRWVDGEPLSRTMAPGRDDGHDRSDGPVNALPLARALDLVRQLADALGHAHDRGVAHGDVNPSNVLVAGDDRLVLIDFGIGRIASGSTLTSYDQIAGTLRYLSPEVIEGGSPTAAGDQYALALLFHEMVTGGWAYASATDDGVTAAATLHHHLYAEPVPLSECLPTAPSSLDPVVARALEKSPDRRFAHVQTFVRSLAEAVALDSGRQTGSPPAPITRPDAAARETTRARPPRPGSRSDGVSLRGLSMGITTIVAALGGLLLLGADEPPDVSSAAASAPPSVAVDATCNAFENATFDDALAANFYRDADNPSLAARVERPGTDGSPFLELGAADEYGVYGIIVDARAGRRYALGADLRFEGYVHGATLSILWLDEDWQTMEGQETSLDIEARAADRYELIGAVAPEGAHHAVPTLFKDASAGTVLVDNLVFFSEDDDCG